MYSGLSLASGVTSEKTEDDAFHKVTGAEFNGGFGTTIAIVPDVDGDMSPELLVGAPMTSATGTQAGSVYGLYGPWESGVMSTALGAKVLHGESIENLGSSIAVGDVGLDGTIDILLGAPGSNMVYGLSASDWFLD